MTPSATEPAPVASFSFAYTSITRNAKALILLHLTIWGAFALFASASAAVLVKWSVIAEMIRLDRASAAVQTWEEWNALQGEVGRYFWSGAMIVGGWGFAAIYLAALSVLFTCCWVITHMVSIRVVTAPKRITAFEGFLIIAKRVPWGLAPYLTWVFLVGLALWMRFAPKVLTEDRSWGTWRIMDVLGALPIAIAISVAFGIAWVFLLPQVTLGEKPSRATGTAVRLVWRAPGLALGRLLGQGALWASASALLVLASYQVIATGLFDSFGSGLIAATTFVVIASGTTWISLTMLPIWLRMSGDSEPAPAVTTFFTAADPQGTFHSDSPEWENETTPPDAAPIYVPTVDGSAIALLEDDSPPLSPAAPLAPAETAELADATTIVVEANENSNDDDTEMLGDGVAPSVLPDDSDQRDSSTAAPAIGVSDDGEGWDTITQPIGLVDESISIPSPGIENAPAHTHSSDEVPGRPASPPLDTGPSAEPTSAAAATVVVPPDAIPRRRAPRLPKKSGRGKPAQALFEPTAITPTPVGAEGDDPVEPLAAELLDNTHATPPQASTEAPVATTRKKPPRLRKRN